MPRGAGRAPKAELLWASPRELLNIFQADEIGCHIITVTHDVLAKLSLVGKDLDDYSLETVKMFHRDAAAAGFAMRRRRAARRPDGLRSRRDPNVERETEKCRTSFRVYS